MRLGYLLRRTREAGPQALAAKMGQKLRPYVYWPVYATNRNPQTGVAERAALRAFGGYCIEAFRVMAETGGSDYIARAAKRLGRAEAPDWHVLGYGAVAKPTGTDWHCDSLHGHHFTPRYFPHVDFLAAHSYCDVKIPWELSRLHWLLWDAEAIATTTLETRAARAQAALATIENWAAANPTGYGVNWTCGMEVAIRGTVLAVICGVLACDLDDAATDRLTALLRAHQQFLARFPEVSDVPGNHYLTDLMGEVVLCAALDGLESARISQALDIFAPAADAQFEEGGCHFERATIYHRLTLDIVALPYALALRAGHASTAVLSRIMQRASAFMAEISSDAGRLPVFGDQDSGFVLWFGEAAQQADVRLCAAPNAPQTDLYNFLGALAGSAAFFPIVTRQPGTRSGFASLAVGPARLVLKTGPQGLEGRAPHDHDDALSLTFALGTHDLLIDPGCHSYTLDPEIRRSQIISSRHNAPVPVRRERFVPRQGSINATMRGAGTAYIEAHTEKALTAILPAGPASGGMQITRNVTLEPGCLQISDTWTLETDDAVRLLWLIHPDWKIHAENSTAKDRLSLPLSCTRHCITAELICQDGEMRIRPDRYSPDYGEWQDCGSLELVSPAGSMGCAHLILTWPED